MRLPRDMRPGAILKALFATKAEAALAVALFALFFLEHLPAHEHPAAAPAAAWRGHLRGAAAWTAAALVPLWALGRRSRPFYWVAPPVWVFCTAAVWFFRLNFRTGLGGSWIGIVAGSSSDEASWFLRTYLGWNAALAFAALAAAAFALVRLASALERSPSSKIRCAAAAVAALLFYRYAMVSHGPFFFLWDSPVATLLTDSAKEWPHYLSLRDMKARPAPADGLARAPGVDAACAGVFVLGESAARSHWSLYGYGRPTTPRMDAIAGELTVFHDLVSPSMTTASAMELILTTATLENRRDLRYTVAQIMRQTGYFAPLFSAQGRWSQFDGVETFAFAGCEPMVFLEEDLPKPWYDDALLARLDAALAPTNRPTVAFLHLAGSHLPPGEKYPPDAAPFPHEDVPDGYVRISVDNYDNSIAFTDSVLGGVIDRLRARGGPAWMLYLSDHGESPASESWRTATDPDIWEVPFIVWLSPEYKARFPETAAALEKAATLPLQSDELLAGILHLAGVVGCGGGTDRDFLDASFRPRAGRKVEDGRRLYKELKEKPERTADES